MRIRGSQIALSTAQSLVASALLLQKLSMRPILHWLQKQRAASQARGRCRRCASVGQLMRGILGARRAIRDLSAGGLASFHKSYRDSRRSRGQKRQSKLDIKQQPAQQLFSWITQHRAMRRSSKLTDGSLFMCVCVKRTNAPPLSALLVSNSQAAISCLTHFLSRLSWQLRQQCSNRWTRRTAIDSERERDRALCVTALSRGKTILLIRALSSLMITRTREPAPALHTGTRSR